MNYLFTLVLLAISGYVLYSAFTAKGKLFAVDNIKEDLIPVFIKFLRPLYFVLGFLLLIMALTSLFQNVVYSDLCYRFTDDFKTYYADCIDSKGNIEGTACNVDGTYSYNVMSSVFGNLPERSNVPEGTNPTYAEAALDEKGAYLYVGAGETEPNQNETYIKLREILSYRGTQILTWVTMGIAIGLVILLFVIMNKFTDKEKVAKAKAAQNGTSLPKSAFVFDDEPESVDHKGKQK